MKVHEAKRGHKRIQLNPGAQHDGPTNRKLKVKYESTSLAESSSGMVGLDELISPVGCASQAAPKKKRSHKKAENRRQELQVDPHQQGPLPLPNNLMNFPQFPMGFSSSGGYYFPGFVPTNGWMFPPLAALPLANGIMQMNAMNANWFGKAALGSNDNSTTSKRNCLSIEAASDSPTKIVGCDNRSRINLVQSMNLIQSNMMFNFPQNYAGVGHQVTVAQPMKCMLCYFVADTALGLLKHIMMVHSTPAAMAAATQSRGSDSIDTGRPLLQSSPLKRQKLMTTKAGMPQMSPPRYVNIVPKAEISDTSAYNFSSNGTTTDTFAVSAHAQHEKYKRMLTREINASIERELRQQREPIDEFTQGSNLSRLPMPRRSIMKLECPENDRVEVLINDVPILATRNHGNFSGVSPDDPAPVFRTPIKQRNDCVSKLDMINAGLQTRQQGSGSSEGYHTSKASSGTSAKDMSANSGHWRGVRGSPTSPQDVVFPSPRSGKLQKAHSSGRKLSRENPTSGDQPEDLSMAGRGRSKELEQITKKLHSQTPTGSNVVNQSSAVRCLNEQFSISHRSPREAEGRREVESAGSSSDSISPQNDARVVTYPHECPHCKVLFCDYAMYSTHMGYHGFSDPFECKLCGKATDNKVEFFNHIIKAEH